MAFPNDVVLIPPGTKEFTDGSTDIVKATAQLLISQGKFTNLLSDLPEYAIAQRIMPRHKKAFGGGLDWTFKAAIANNNKGNSTAKAVGLYEADTFGNVDVLVEGKVSPRYITANYVYDKREKVLNSGEVTKDRLAAIVDFVNLRLQEMWQSYWDKVETTFGGVGITSAADKKNPHGIAFYLQKQSNADAESHPLGHFDGKDPMLKTSDDVATLVAVPRCEIATSTYSRWANYAAQYTEITKEDLVRKMRRAAHMINFKSPLSLVDPKLSTGRSILTNLNVLSKLEEILEAQNMNLGNDVASKDGKTLFKGTPIEYIPIFDGDTQDPIYMIDWNTLCFGTQSGWEKKVTAPTPSDAAHNTMRGFLDVCCEMVCTNLRNQAVIAKAFA